MYDQRADPHELVNLAGRKEYREKADELREELKKLIVASGEPEPEIAPAFSLSQVRGRHGIPILLGKLCTCSPEWDESN
jgi:hypothetical protein